MIAFVDTSDSYCELNIFQLGQADIDRVFKTVRQKEESCRIFCVTWSASIETSIQLYIPNLCFPSSAYAFFIATVRHFASWKLF
jgi:hypothetical protein